MNPDTVRALRPLVKLAGETLPAAIDFTALLNSSETLTGSPTVAISPAGLSSSSESVIAAAFTPLAGGSEIAVGKGVALTLTGGASGQRYTLTVTCATSQTGRIVGGQVVVLIDA